MSAEPELKPNRIVMATYSFPNGMIATFGHDGEQIPELQGRYSLELIDKIKVRSNKNTSFNGFGYVDKSDL